MDLLPWEALVISIHTLHTEGDSAMELSTVIDEDFNPHPPHGG